MRTLVLSYRTRQSLCFVESAKKNESMNKKINQVKKKNRKQKNRTNKQGPDFVILHRARFLIIWPGSQDKLTLEALDTIIWYFVVVKA